MKLITYVSKFIQTILEKKKKNFSYLLATKLSKCVAMKSAKTFLVAMWDNINNAKMHVELLTQSNLLLLEVCLQIEIHELLHTV